VWFSLEWTEKHGELGAKFSTYTKAKRKKVQSSSWNACRKTSLWSFYPWTGEWMYKKVGYLGVERFHLAQDRPSSLPLCTAFQTRREIFYRLLSDY